MLKFKFSFYLQYEERKFELRAENEEVCDKWIYVLDYLRTNLKAKQESFSQNLPIKVEPEGKTPESNKITADIRK